MGKRKSAKKVQKKEMARVMSKFDCVLCNHNGCIRVVIQKKAKFGGVKCSVCDTKWETTITALTEPIDIYCEWVDACEEANKQPVKPATQRRERQAAPREEDSEDEGIGAGSDDD
mmetsp:Transcript_39768/g.62105  ORF Transcript_39768/g.62105 Transcript_39768/m.62105 type:complete len:115 (-) Transcript_39768:1611-1955(-)